MSRRTLPPLSALVFFDAAARASSFSAAARTLNATQPAVSHQVALLEADLGVTLFERRHSGVILTEAGRSFQAAVRDSLDRLEQARAEFSGQHARDILHVATDFGFAACWLIPRLHEFSALAPKTEVRVVAGQGAIDLRHGDADIAIAFGDDAFPGATCRALFPEKVVPVCSPGLLQRSGPVDSPEKLLNFRLLHLQRSPPERWLDWDDWFAFQRVLPGRRSGDITFNTYQMVLQAAAAGQGIALGWLPLVDDMLAAGQLVKAVPTVVTTDRGYFLVEQPGHTNPTGLAFRRWLLDRCAQPKTPEAD